MPINLVSPLAQIEFAVSDIPAIGGKLKNIFSASPIEEDFYPALSLDGVVQVMHYGLGEAMLQYVHPIDPSIDHATVLNKNGPFIFNLTWFVESIDDALKACDEAGYTALSVHDVAAFAFAKLLEPDNIVDDGRAGMIDTMSVLGFNLELAELPWKVAPSKPFLCPAYYQPRPVSNDKVKPLESINIVVADLELARKTVIDLFFNAAPSAIKVLANGDAKRCFSVILGDVVLVYYEPAANGVKADFLQRFGSGIDSLVYPTECLNEIKQCAETEVIDVVSDEQALLVQQSGRSGTTAWVEAWRMQCRSELGVDIHLLC